MALSNYNRAYSLSIAIPQVDRFESYAAKVDGSTYGLKNNILESNEYSVISQTSPDFRSDYNNAKEITEQHLEAYIVKSGKSSVGSLNHVAIRIYNLSESTRSAICKVDNNVILKAGYNPDFKSDVELPILYTGQIESFNNKKAGNDYITTLICKDGYIPTNSVRVGIYWPAPTGVLRYQTYGDLIRKVQSIWSANGIKSTNNSVVTDLASYVLEAPDDIPLYGGYTFQGYLRQLCDQICGEIGYKWYIDNSILYIEPRQSLNKKTRYTFPLDLSHIISIDDYGNNVRATSTNKEPTGIQLEVFLDGRFELGKYVEITEGTKKGVYKIVRVEHRLEYRGQSWVTKCICEKDND